MSWQTVSIVVPHYGDPMPTRELVAAVRDQARRHGGTVVVVDDASPTPLGEIEGATVVRRELNGGFGAAVNAGVALVESDLVAVLNSDLRVRDRFLDEWVEAARPWMPAVVAPQVVTPGHPGATTFRFPAAHHVLAQSVNLVGVRRGSRWASDLIGEDRPAAPGDTAIFEWVTGAAMLMPTESFRAVGGFDERFHMYLEEVDLQRRLRDLGLPSVYTGDVVVEHAGFASSDPTKRERWALDSWFAYADKWGWRRRLSGALVTGAMINLATDGLRRTLGRDVRPLATWRRRLTLVREARSGQARRQT